MRCVHHFGTGSFERKINLKCTVTDYSYSLRFVELTPEDQLHEKGKRQLIISLGEESSRKYMEINAIKDARLHSLIAVYGQRKLCSTEGEGAQATREPTTIILDN